MRILEVARDKGALCAEILAALPDWFGLPQANADYIRDVEGMAVWAAARDDARIGFLAVKQPTPAVFEIHVMGVKPGHHRAGAGRALVDAAAAHARRHGARALTAKTLSARDPDAGYARTRSFYAGIGFWPVDELPEAMSPGNPQVLLLKPIG